jgi:ankyrin repeat protein
MTPLHYAAFFNSSAVVDVLVTKAKPDLNAPCSEFEGGTPLHLAAMAGAAESVSQLIKHGADASVGDASSRTALECATQIAQLQKGGDAPGLRSIIAELTQVTPKVGARSRQVKLPFDMRNFCPCEV